MNFADCLFDYFCSVKIIISNNVVPLYSCQFLLSATYSNEFMEASLKNPNCLQYRLEVNLEKKVEYWALLFILGRRY